MKKKIWHPGRDEHNPDKRRKYSKKVIMNGVHMREKVYDISIRF